MTLNPPVAAPVEDDAQMEREWEEIVAKIVALEGIEAKANKARKVFESDGGRATCDYYEQFNDVIFGLLQELEAMKKSWSEKWNMPLPK